MHGRKNMEYIKINDSELEDLERKYFEMVEKHQVEPLKNSMKEDREKHTTKHEKKHKDMYRAIISEMMQFSGRKITEYGASQKISTISISLAREAIKSGYCEEAAQCLKVAKDSSLTQCWAAISVKEDLLNLTRVVARKSDKDLAKDQVSQLIADVTMGEYGKDTAEDLSKEMIEKTFSSCSVEKTK